MADAYIGEIRMVGFPYAPRGWSNADGQILDIDQYSALYSLYGKIYGGDGRENFGLPNLCGRVPIHCGRGAGLPDYVMGQMGGAPMVVLTPNETPVHTHPAAVNANTATADQSDPTNHYWAANSRPNPYAASHNTTMGADAVEVGENTGGGQPHENMQPYLTIRFCVCMEGAYPPRN